MKTYTIQRGFLTQKINGKLAIFNGTKSLLYTLNDSAAYIFQGIKLKWSEEKILEGMEKLYGISKKQAVKDFRECIALLEKHAIIQEK